MILNPEWLKPKEKPYFHQISLDCIEKLVDCIGRFNNGEIDADISFKIAEQILTNGIRSCPRHCNYGTFLILFMLFIISNT